MFRSTLALVLLGVPLSASAEPAWTRQVVPGHEVSVELPGPGKHRQKQRSSWVGRIVTDTLVADLGDGWCAATVTKAPKVAMSFASDARVLGSARDNVLEDYAAREVSWSPVTRDGEEGMRLVFDTRRDPTRPERGIAEFFTQGDTIVTVVALRPADAQGSVERLFASVDLGR